MAISRRDVLLGGAGAAGAAAFSFPVPAIAQSEPIKVGCLAAMTGPRSKPKSHAPVSYRLTQGALEQGLRTSRPELLPPHRQAKKDPRDRRYHRLWRDRGRRFGRGIQEGWC